MSSSVSRGRAAATPAFIALSCVGLFSGAAHAATADDPNAGDTEVAASDEEQTRTPSGQTIVVTGERVPGAQSTRQTADALDAPQTIAVIPADIIRQRAATSLTEVLRNTPGISFNAGENGFSTSSNNFSLRGFDTSGGIFIDGSRDSGSYTRDIFNIQQVEVFKGPTADNGRGGAGGYINLVSKIPSLADLLSANFSVGFDEYGSDARLRGSFDVNQILGEGMALRVNGVAEQSGVPGRELADRGLWGIAPSLAFGLGGSFRAILSYEHVSQSGVPDWGVPGATIPGTLAFNAAAAGAPREAFYGLASDTDDTDSDVAMLRLEYDAGGGVTLSNQTRFARVDRFARYTVPTGFVAATQQVTTQTQYYDRQNETFTNLTNLRAVFATGGLRHTLSAGIDLTRERSDANRYGTLNPGNTGLLAPNPFRTVSPALAPTEVNEVDIDTIAFYLYNTIALSEQFEITGGIRGESYDASISSLTLAGAGSGAVNGYQDSEFTLGGRIGLVFKPTPQSSLYASYGTAALPPGSFLSNPDISRTGDNAFPGFVPGARPVRADNFEVGGRWGLLNGRLVASFAAFHTEKSNVPVTGRDVGETVDSLKGYHEQTVQGVELGITGQITPAWNVFGGIAVIESERHISAALNDARRRANAGDYGTFLTVDGDELAFTPNVTANLWTTYRFPIGLTIGGGVQYVGSSFLGRPDDALRIIPNGQFGKLPAYTLVGLMASYQLTENIDIRVNVDNLFDEFHASSTNWNGSRATLGPPRTFLVSAGFSF